MVTSNVTVDDVYILDSRIKDFSKESLVAIGIRVALLGNREVFNVLMVTVEITCEWMLILVLV